MNNLFFHRTKWYWLVRYAEKLPGTEHVNADHFVSILCNTHIMYLKHNCLMQIQISMQYGCKLNNCLIYLTANNLYIFLSLFRLTLPHTTPHNLKLCQSQLWLWKCSTMAFTTHRSSDSIWIKCNISYVFIVRVSRSLLQIYWCWQ